MPPPRDLELPVTRRPPHARLLGWFLAANALAAAIALVGVAPAAAGAAHQIAVWCGIG